MRSAGTGSLSVKSMQALLDEIARRSGLILLCLAGFAVLLLLLTIVLFVRLAKVRKTFRTLLEGASGANLEAMLLRQQSDYQEAVQKMERINREIVSLNERMRMTKRFVGLKRYDAFPDMAGEQSFALAVYDDNGDGVVITSIVGRADCRVYCKKLIAGRAIRDLSDEERSAIDQAAMAPVGVAS